jgi:hypothetical protein
MGRKSISVIWLLALTVAPFPFAEAQQPKKIPRMGFVTSFGSPSKHQIEAFREGLKERGYIEGKTFWLSIAIRKGVSTAPQNSSLNFLI